MKYTMLFIPLRAKKERNKKLYTKNTAVGYTVTIIGDDLKILSLWELDQISGLQDKKTTLLQYLLALSSSMSLCLE